MKHEAQQLLEKAARALHAAETLIDAGDAEFAAGRAYYAMLYIAEALLRQKGLEYRKHSGVHAAFGEHFAKTGILDAKYHRALLDSFDERLAGDYDFHVDLSTEAVSVRVDQARDFLTVAQAWLEEQTETDT